jgi:hypothetical protein
MVYWFLASVLQFKMKGTVCDIPTGHDSSNLSCEGFVGFDILEPLFFARSNFTRKIQTTDFDEEDAKGGF